MNIATITRRSTAIGALCFAFNLAFLAPHANAQSYLFMDTIQGGISIDASGVWAANPGWNAGPNLIVQIPAGSVLTRVYAIVRAKSGGFNPAVNVPASVEVNGVPLSSGLYLPGASNGVARVFLLNPITFGITTAGSYSYRELNPVDELLYAGYGVGGTTLAVIYTHATLPGTRFVCLAVDQVSSMTRLISALPTSGTEGQLVLSVGIDWECSDEQSFNVSVAGVPISITAGGRDDGPAYNMACANQDFNSLITQGSFGFDDTDALVGTDGDSPSSDPGCCAMDSRMSDELWSAGYDESGSVAIGFSGSPSAWVTTYAVVVEMASGTGAATTPQFGASLDVFPNPFNPSTRIRYTVPASGSISLSLFDVRGRLLETLMRDEYKTLGIHELDYRSHLNSGVYVLRLQWGAGVASRKIVILK